jgi:hypothetical protein
MAKDYYKFTARARLDKSINSLLGLVEGISIDGILNDKEMRLLATWIIDHEDRKELHPYNEILPLLTTSTADGKLTDDERADILYMCEKLRSTDYYNDVTAGLQRLHTLLAGIAADNVISTNELIGLSDWLSEHEYLRKCWPYDEIDSLITSVLADKKIDATEHELLLSFFAEFAHSEVNKRNNPSDVTLPGICSVSPAIEFSNTVFCFTGETSKMSRDDLLDAVATRGGRTVTNVSKVINYLVIGAAGNPCWKYACYGRKIEQAMNYRKEGYPIVLVHESDFFDAISE